MRFEPHEPKEWTSLQEAVSELAPHFPAMKRPVYPFPFCDAKLSQGQAVPASSGSAVDAEAARSSRQGHRPGESEGSHAGPCDQTPHCAGFDDKHGGLPAKKQLQYKFLYAAHGHCVACMRHYAQQAGLDKSCTSCGKNARQWAQSGVGGRKQQKVVIPADVEDWLRSNDL